MEMIKCKNGHRYDPEKHSMCPHCGINIDMDGNAKDRRGNQGGLNPTGPAANKDNSTVAKEKARFSPEAKTVGLDNLGWEDADPVVGWFVCIEGPSRGKDYRIHRGRNFIGRSENMDICIAGDKHISRDKHAIVIYDPKSNEFMIQPGESREMVYHNGTAVFNVEPLKPRSMIELGTTKLLFIPLCGGDFKWQEKQD